MNSYPEVEAYLARIRENDQRNFVAGVLMLSGAALVLVPLALAFTIARLPVAITLAATGITKPFGTLDEQLDHNKTTNKVTEGLLLVGIGAGATAYLIGPATAASMATALYSAAATAIMQCVAAVGATAALSSAVAAAPFILTGVGVLITGGILAKGALMIAEGIRE